MPHPVDNDLDELENFLKDSVLRFDRWLRAVRSMRSHNEALQAMIAEQGQESDSQPDDTFEVQFFKTVEDLISRKRPPRI